MFYMLMFYGILFISLFAPYCLCNGLCRITYGDDNLVFKDRVLCAIPMINYWYGFKVYNGKAISAVPIINTLTVVILVARLVSLITGMAYPVQLVLTLVLIAMLLINIVTHVIFVYSVLSSIVNYSSSTCLIFSLLLPVGILEIYKNVPKYIEYYDKQKGDAIWTE